MLRHGTTTTTPADTSSQEPQLPDSEGILKLWAKIVEKRADEWIKYDNAVNQHMKKDVVAVTTAACDRIFNSFVEISSSDSDKTGNKISTKKLLNMAFELDLEKEILEDFANAMIKEADTDGDSELSYEEFLALLRKLELHGKVEIVVTVG